jgi:hypothetical protein
MSEETKVLGRKPLLIKNVTPECHQKLKIYSAITEKPQADALDEALTVAIRVGWEKTEFARRKSLFDVFESTAYDLKEEPALVEEGE